MGQIKKGILGGFSGKVGNVVGTSWLGRDVIRSLPTPSKKLPTLKQALARQRLGAGSSFLKPLAPVVKICYQHNGNSTKWNLLCKNTFAKTFNLSSDGNYFNVNLADIKVSMGSLDSLGNYTVDDAANTIKLTWNFQATSSANSDDVLRILYFDYKKGRVALVPINAMRQSGEIIFSLPPDFSRDESAIYAFFTSKDGKQISDSEYIKLNPTKSSEIHIPTKKLCPHRVVRVYDITEKFSLENKLFFESNIDNKVIFSDSP